jgi:hypothetical protein
MHATLAARSDTREMLQAVREIGASCGPAIPPSTDYMHYDFTPANLLTDGATITGVVDINAPVLAVTTTESLHDQGSTADGIGTPIPKSPARSARPPLGHRADC